MAKQLSAYNIYMRRALKGKMRGKTKAQRKKIFRDAAKGWKKKKPKKHRDVKVVALKRAGKWTAAGKRSKYYVPSKSKSTGGRSMGKKGFLNTQTIFKFVRLGALAAPAVAEAMSGHSTPGKIQNIIRMYTGFHTGTGQWNWRDLLAGWMPYIGANLVTHGIPKLISMIRRI